ncbi:cation diffusion facilitator family transporter [Geomicrobium sp. JCM 19038]|uniref:cation diffusion facilitator family transporter n=1 Tax=Geomicrobium sp. JCM 19038 TaxID=1460635 RepID=UPI00045F36EA|nr:cation diffusion facilitator family transporter [Geomicrobium sp. JCM 19038]GAK08217.1 cobalt-zinc-cadmium resistance protein [Geomicrobium sp. JCM 19038]
MEQKRYSDLKRGERGAYLSLVTYILLAVVKIWVAYITSSAALRADGLNNATDIIVSIAVLIGLRIAQRPPDHNHPYGHFRAETVASLVASFIIMLIGLHVLFEAMMNLFSGEVVKPDSTAAWVGTVSFIVMMGVYRYNAKLGKQIKSQAIQSVAKDNLSDALVSAAATLGILGAQFGLPWLDVVLAVIVGGIICKTAFDIFRKATYHLTDGFQEQELQAFRNTILSISEVEQVKEVKARYYGSSSAVEVVIAVDRRLDIVDAHNISTAVEKRMIEEHEAIGVLVHVEPS